MAFLRAHSAFVFREKTISIEHIVWGVFFNLLFNHL